MKPILSAAVASLGMLACPHFAAAQPDPTTAARVSCVPESVTRCTAPGQCATREATPHQKAQMLVIDFAAKTVAFRRDGETSPEGTITEDKIVDGVRHIAMTVKNDGQKVAMTLTKAGRLSIAVGETGNKAEATCTAES